MAEIVSHWFEGNRGHQRIRAKAGTHSRAEYKPDALPPCPHLGPAIERDGITLKVKCGCSGKEHDQPHAAHECGLYKRCLPTLRPANLKAWEERPESQLYRCCHGCDRGISAASGAE